MLEQVLNIIPLDIVCLMETCVFPSRQSLSECKEINLLCSAERRRNPLCYLVL